jgi:hypothetical protein
MHFTPHPNLLPQGEKERFGDQEASLELTELLFISITETYFGQECFG